MSKLLFSYGKSNETTTDEQITTETTVIPVASTSGFAEGQKAFISEADHTELTYLGAITTVNAGVNIEVTYGVSNKEIGAKVWSSTYYIEFDEAHSYPVKTSEQVVQAIGRSAGGKIRVSKKGVVQSRLILDFEAMSKNDYDNLINWYKNKVEGAGKTFLYCDVERNVECVKIISESIDWTEIGYQLFSGSVTLEEIPGTPDWF